MATAVRAASALQIGKESTPGTAVAASRRMIARSATWRRIQNTEHFENQIGSSLLVPSFRVPIIVREHTEMRVEFELDTKQVLWPLLSCIKGGVTPTTPGSGSARLWTFTPGVAADPAPDPYTVEFTESSFTDEVEFEAPYVVCPSFEISAEATPAGGVPMMTCDFFGRKTQESTKTGSLNIPTLNSDVQPMARWAVYFDATWANLGTTQITGQIKSFRFRYNSGVRPNYALDNRTDLDFSGLIFGKRSFELTMRVLHDPASSKFVQTEEGKRSPPDKRNVRLKITGDAFSAPDNGLNRFLQIDGAYYHAADSMVVRGEDEDGNLIVDVHLVGTYDTTQGQDIVISVQNAEGSWP